MQQQQKPVIAITGTTGFLGARAAQYLAQEYQVVAVTRSAVDLTDGEAVQAYFAQLKPQYVIHSAAISDIAETAKYPELSHKVNLLAPYYIAKACAENGAKMLNLSSDQVYSGNEERVPLCESVSLHPNNLYGQQKYEAEQRVASVLPSAVSLRLTWMYDLPSAPLPQHHAFAPQLFEALQTGASLRVNTNQLRSVTYIGDVVQNLFACFALPGGAYNFGSENELSLYEFYLQAADCIGLPRAQIVPFAGDLRNLLISTQKLQAHGIVLPSAIDGFCGAMTQHKNSGALQR